MTTTDYVVEVEAEEEEEDIVADSRPVRTRKPRPTKAPRTKRPRPTKGPKPTRAPKPTAPTESNMECYTVTELATDGVFWDAGDYQYIHCDYDYEEGWEDALIGCTTYRLKDGTPQKGSFGSKFVNNYFMPRFYCESWADESEQGRVGMAGRCCKSTSPKAVLKPQQAEWAGYNYDTNCAKANGCDTSTGAVQTGCTPLYYNQGSNGGLANLPA